MEDIKNETQTSNEEVIQLRPRKTTTKPKKAVETTQQTVTVDVNDIDSLLKAVVSTRNVIDQNEDLNKIRNANSATVQVCCAQSGYIANMTPLRYDEFFKMANSEETNYESKKLTYKTIFEKIKSTSINDWNRNFEDWLRATSIYDMETLCYGIFCATYQNKGHYQYTCPHCNTQLDIVLTHDRIIHTADAEEMSALVEDITKNAKSIDDMQRLSLVLSKHKTLPVSNGLVFELKIPSLYDMLALIRSFTDDELEELEDSSERFILTMLLSIESVFVPVSGQPGKYTKITRKKDIRSIINDLPVLDIYDLRNAVHDSIKRNHITYSIRDAKCTNPKCTNPHEEKIIPFIPLNLEEILFAHIVSLI